MHEPLRRQALIPSPRRPSPRVLMAALGTSLGLNLLLATEPGAPDAPAASPLSAPASVDLIVPAPVRAAPVPAVPLVPACELVESDPDPRRWTIAPDHFGPFSACDLDGIDLAGVRALVPGLEVATPAHEAFEVDVFLITQHDQPLIRLIPLDGTDAVIEIHSRTIATPWGVRVGDRSRDVRKRHRDLRCFYGAAEGDESVWCQRSGDTGDGWVDNLTYGLDLRGLSRRDRAVLERGEDLPASRFDDLRIEMITWRPSTAG